MAVFFTGTFFYPVSIHYLILSGSHTKGSWVNDPVNGLADLLMDSGELDMMSQLP
ncbi:hypothetical protein [Vibrio mangrovi]|uniref:Uncharacterized protein n=1 Tax=Vibrio mangrovi TaxID=474394 RepID=A0ABU4I4H6_9VIBR|nr:hypothetical protein [Vibrio mangrovi]MDW6002840.1 hypothetical protein [Vibrio mangrovi]